MFARGVHKPLNEPKPTYKSVNEGAFEIVNSAMQSLTSGLKSEAVSLLAGSIRSVEKLSR